MPCDCSCFLSLYSKANLDQAADGFRHTRAIFLRFSPGQPVLNLRPLITPAPTVTRSAFPDNEGAGSGPRR
jgi:hypothetical protein